ncbi:LPXTG cell wall anchor domain-containing protein [Enterococcus avium]|uniref:LPXTG cell wall anchor domain-containing protein n=1 Tax=Enterococcus avium TaxID=33945 RepID=UPI0037BDAB5B
MQEGSLQLNRVKYDYISQKQYPKTNDSKSSFLWVIFGISLFGTAGYLLKKMW